MVEVPTAKTRIRLRNTKRHGLEARTRSIYVNFTRPFAYNPSKADMHINLYRRFLSIPQS